MYEAIARENIKHFRKLLETEKRKTITQLLLEERPSSIKLSGAKRRAKVGPFAPMGRMHLNRLRTSG